MDEVFIKAVNGGYVVKGTCREQTSFFAQLKQKLEACAAHAGERFPVFFDVEGCLSEADYERIFHICETSGALCMGFDQEQKDDLMIVETSLYPGKQYFYRDRVLLLQDVPKDCYVTCLKDVYVLGTIFGQVDVFDQDAKIAAGCFDHAQVRICDSCFQNMTNDAPLILYYQEGALKCKPRRESNGRSNRDHIG